jgi:hypothetical protein
MAEEGYNKNAFLTDEQDAALSQHLKECEEFDQQQDEYDDEQTSQPQGTLPEQGTATGVPAAMPPVGVVDEALLPSPTMALPAPSVGQDQPARASTADVNKLKGKATVPANTPSGQSKDKKHSKGASTSAPSLKPRDKPKNKGPGILPYQLDVSLQHFLLTGCFTAETTTRSAKNSIRVAARLYALQDDKLLRRLSTGDLRLVPKVEDLPRIFQQCHGQGHPGQRATYNRVRRTYWWKNMKTMCYQYVKSCEYCQKQHDVSQRTDRELQPVSVEGLLPFQKVAIDLAGPLPKTITGNVHMIVMVCYLTKWIEAVAVKDNTAFTVSQAFFKEIVCRYGCPFEVSMDNGSHFQGEFLVQLKAWGMDRVRIAPYNPQANGLVERCIQTLKGSLSRTALQRTDTWDEQLPWTLLAYRNVLQKSTGYTPYSLVFGRQMMLPEQIHLHANRFQMSEQDSLQHLTGQLTVVAKQMEHSLMHAQGNVELSQQKQRLDFETRKRTQASRVKQVRDLPLGSLVLAKLPDSTVTSLQPSWTGPFVLQGYTTAHQKTAILLDSKGKLKYRAVAQVKPYYAPDPQLVSSAQCSILPIQDPPTEMQRRP